MAKTPNKTKIPKRLLDKKKAHEAKVAKLREMTTERLDQLQPHLLQGTVLSDLTEGEIQAMADDIRRNGQTHPIEVTANRMILDGHQRVKAMLRLGWTKAKVLVRHDLETGEASTARFLEANLNRRHLDPLARVRLIKSLYALGEEVNVDVGKGKIEIKERIAKQLGMNRRTLDRYLCAADAPPAVLKAFEDGDVTLTEAGKVAGLTADIQSAIEKRIVEGETPKAAVQSYLPPVNRSVAPSSRLKKLIRSADAIIDHYNKLADTEEDKERVRICARDSTDSTRWCFKYLNATHSTAIYSCSSIDAAID